MKFIPNAVRVQGRRFCMPPAYLSSGKNLPDFRLGPLNPAGNVSVLAVTSARGKTDLKKRSCLQFGPDEKKTVG